MNKNKKTSPIKNMDSIQYMFFDECENTSENNANKENMGFSIQTKLMNPFYEIKYKKPTDIYFDMDENGVIGYSDPFCKHCYSHKVTKYGYNKRDLINDDGEHVITKVQRYYCPICGKYSQTEFE